MRKYKYNTSIILLILILVIAGCAHFLKSPKNEKFLQKKVQKEWEAKMEKDWGAVYDLTCNEFKAKVKREKFIQGANLNVENFSIEKIEIDPENGKAWATIRFDINQMGFPFKGITLKEEWIWEEGEWRLNLKPKSTPFD